MPQFLANENIPKSAISTARAAGIDIACGLEENPGHSDEEVLREAANSPRVPVTLDKDPGELAFRRGKSSVTGIVQVRPKLKSPDHVAQFFTNVRQQSIDDEGYIIVADETHVRLVPLQELSRRLSTDVSQVSA